MNSKLSRAEYSLHPGQPTGVHLVVLWAPLGQASSGGQSGGLQAAVGDCGLWLFPGSHGLDPGWEANGHGREGWHVPSLLPCGFGF